MYKTRNIELVINDSILNTIKQCGIHMQTSCCTAHNENNVHELHWSLYFDSTDDAAKFADEYKKAFNPHFEVSASGEIVDIFVMSDNASEVGTDEVRKCLDDDYAFIDAYCSNHHVKLSSDRESDLLIMLDEEYGWGNCWSYVDGAWVADYEG